MKNNQDKTQSRAHADQLNELLAESVMADQSLDSSTLESRILSQTQSMPQSQQSRLGLLSRLIPNVSPLNLPEWTGGAVVTAAVLVMVLTVVPVRFSGDTPAVNTAIDPQELILSENEDDPAELLWEEILLLEDEIAFSSL